MSNSPEEIHSKLRAQAEKVAPKQSLEYQEGDLVNLEEMKDNVKVTVAARTPERALALLRQARALVKRSGGYDTRARLDKSGNT